MTTPVIEHVLGQLRAERHDIARLLDAIDTAIAALTSGQGITITLPPVCEPETSTRDTPPRPGRASRNARQPAPEESATSGATQHPSRSTRPRTTRGSGSAAYTLDDIAATAQEAWATGQAAETLIVTRHGISASAARNAMNWARQKGILGPRPTGPTDPIGRTPFDPEQARMAAAEAL